MKQQPDIMKQYGWFDPGTPRRKRGRLRKQLYDIPQNSLADIDSRTLYILAGQTGTQILLHFTGNRLRIDECLACIETAMEGKKWVLVVIDTSGDAGTAQAIRQHRTDALYFVKEQVDPEKCCMTICDILISISNVFSSFFPWICFVSDETPMHPFKTDILLSHALCSGSRAAIGSSVFKNRITTDDPEIVKASDTGFWLRNFRYGIFSLIFHHSLLCGLKPPDIMQAYQQIVSHHAVPIDKAVVQCIVTGPETGKPETSASPVFSACNLLYRDGESSARQPLHQPESFSIVATAKLADELLITLKSLRQYHDQPVYLVCDSYVKDLVATGKFGNVICFDELNEQQLGEIRNTYFTRPYNEIWKFPPSQPNPPLLIKKMEVMSRALAENSNTLMLDADMIFLGPVEHGFNESIVLSPEINDYRVFLDEQGREHIAAGKDYPATDRQRSRVPERFCYQLHDVFGLFNAGFVFTQDRTFPLWWKEHFLNDSKFLEQEALNRVWKDFTFGIFSEEYNYGFWKLWRLATPRFRKLIKKRISFHGRIRFDVFCGSAKQDFLLGAYFNLLSGVFSYADIADAAGFSAGNGIWFNGRRLRNFHIHVFYTSSHPYLASRWRFMKDFALSLIGASTDPLHRELMSYISFLTEHR